MNFQTITPSAKLYKKLQTYATGQTVTSGEVPNIAIINAVDILASKKLVENVIFGVRSKGGTENVFNTANLGYANKINPMTAKYAESFSRMMACNCEAIIKTNLIDGVVIIADCEVTASGLLLGALKANCPAIVLPIGTNNDDYDILRVTGRVTAGKINALAGEALIKDSIMPRGQSNMLNSVSSFFTAIEAMGLCLINASLNMQGSSAQMRVAIQTGEQICANAKNLLSPKNFLTKVALTNATALLLSVGGCVSALNFVIPLVAANDNKIAHEFISELSNTTPLLIDSANQKCSHLNNVGGINAVLKILNATPKLINGEAITVSGDKLKNTLAEIQCELSPISKTAKVMLLKGSAVETGCYCQPGAGTPSLFSGKAWVYYNLEDAGKALLSGNIPDNSVIVVHNCLDIYVSSLIYAIEGMEKQKQIAVMTDGLCEKTDALVLTKCRPSSLDNEAFANIQNGDIIDIDLSKARVNFSVSAKDLKARAKRNASRKQAMFFQ